MRSRVAAVGALPWVVGHVVLYCALLAGGSCVAQLVGDSSRPVGENVALGVVGALVWSYLLVPVIALLLALLRLGKELQWYWFRIVALVLLNLPDLLVLRSGSAWVFPAVHTALALLVIQPRWSLED